MSPVRRLALVLVVLSAGAARRRRAGALRRERRDLAARGLDAAGRARRAGVGRARRDAVIRLPRIAVAVLAGGALAVAGVAFQALTRNPLAEPSVLGVTSGAAFGVVIGQSFGLGWGILDAPASPRSRLPARSWPPARST